MKVHLMYKNRDFQVEEKESYDGVEIVKDLELDTIFQAMSGEDKLVLNVAGKAILSGLTEMDEIRYRQDILKDCLRNRTIVREFYSIAGETIAKEKEHRWGVLSSYPGSILHRSIDVMKMYIEMMRKLRNFAADSMPLFFSEGFVNLFQTLVSELDEEYLSAVQIHVQNLSFDNGIQISTALGEGLKGIDFTLCEPKARKNMWKDWIQSRKVPGYTYCLAAMDESGAKALSDIKDRGMNTVANAVAQSCDHILSFFHALRKELAFYIGCINLEERLKELNEPVCIPAPLGKELRNHSFSGLYDLPLVLNLNQKVVGNQMYGDGKKLIMITGANQGGKTTFLRSIGQAQVMMQSGMFVGADNFSANLCDRVFTHFKREEDAGMKSGKLDEELRRMSRIADELTVDSMILFNEPFASTNEREGSEIGSQITEALLDKGIKIFTVTHLFQFSSGFYNQKRDDAIFLRAERNDDGSRAFILAEGEPLRTGFGEDIYSEIFSDLNDNQIKSAIES